LTKYDIVSGVKTAIVILANELSCHIRYNFWPKADFFTGFRRLTYLQRTGEIDLQYLFFILNKREKGGAKAVTRCFDGMQA